MMRALLPLMRLSATLLLALCCAVVALADSKAETLKPQPEPRTEAELRAELEAEYRTALEARLAQESASYEGSIRSLWMSSAGVWAVLLAFVAWQALHARKLARELNRLRDQRG